jgi:hypothetical protein
MPVEFNEQRRLLMAGIPSSYDPQAATVYMLWNTRGYAIPKAIG